MLPKKQCTQQEQLPREVCLTAWTIAKCRVRCQLLWCDLNQVASSQRDQHELVFSTCSAPVIPSQVAGRPIRFSLFFFFIPDLPGVCFFECVEMCVWKYESKALRALKQHPFFAAQNYPNIAPCSLFSTFSQLRPVQIF